MKRITREEMFGKIVKIVSQRSTCLRKQVGAIIVKDGRLISIGYNGAPSGMPHCTSETCNKKTPCKRTIHAEINAIAFAAKSGISIEGAELYTTLEPCYECCKAIINSGIKKVYYLEPYRDHSGIEFLTQVGIVHYYLCLNK